MTCLSDETIYELADGAGDDTERAHAETCPWCARRLGALRADLGVITATLRGERPAGLPPAPRARAEVRWAAIAAMLVLLAAGGVWRARDARVARGLPAVAAAWTELSDDVFDEPGLVDEEGEDEALAAAFEAAAPCEWQSNGCEDVNQPLF